MRVALIVAAKDLRQRLRNRSAILTSIVAPLGLAVIFSQLLGSAVQFHATYVVADLDGGQLSTVLRQEVIGGLVSAGVATVSDVPTEAAARQAVDDGSADAAFIVPAGFTAAIQAGQAVTLDVVGARNAGLATEVARAVAQRFADGVAAVQLSVATAAGVSAAPLSTDDVTRIATAATSAPPALTLVDQTSDVRQLSLPTYYSAAMAALFLFLTAQMGLVSIFTERDRGTLRRILAGPLRPSQVLWGKLLGGFLQAVIAMAVLIVATTALIEADWGPPLGVAIMVVAGILAAMGISTLVVSFFHTAEAAGAASSAVAITLGILGGTFAPTNTAPDIMARVALLTPHAWFLRGLGEMAGSSGTIAGCLPAAGVLLVMAAVTGGIGLARSGRLVSLE
jgi:ABC-2 type transport system permease protein